MNSITLVIVGLFALNSTATLAQENELLGLWASETTFAPALQGELTLRRAGEVWRAIIGGAEAQCTTEAGAVRCPFSQNRGLYRGALTNGEPTAGWWVRPSGETEDRNDPGGSGQSFAGRVELRKTGADEWRGTVQPLDDRFNLYLRISHNEDGALVGAFRNPDLNSMGGASYFFVTREGDTVRFYRRAPDGRELRQEATLLRSPDRLKIFWRDLGTVLELKRSGRNRTGGSTRSTCARCTTPALTTRIAPPTRISWAAR